MAKKPGAKPNPFGKKPDPKAGKGGKCPKCGKDLAKCKCGEDYKKK